MNPWKKLLRLAAVVFALTVLVGYVVYSQLRYTNTTSSLSGVAPDAAPNPGPPDINYANVSLLLSSTKSLDPASLKSALVIPGSKVLAPILSVPGGESAVLSRRSASNTLVAPGSKSGAIFSFGGTTQLTPGRLDDPKTFARNHTTNFVFTTKIVTNTTPSIRSRK